MHAMFYLGAQPIFFFLSILGAQPIYLDNGKKLSFLFEKEEIVELLANLR